MSVYITVTDITDRIRRRRTTTLLSGKVAAVLDVRWNVAKFTRREWGTVERGNDSAIACARDGYVCVQEAAGERMWLS